MRKHFSANIEQRAKENNELIFITGDLGYNALELVGSVMGDRFINAGVAEQNMIGAAAGIASQGFEVVCYSIAPFVVYRCLEQVRNDVCFHKKPVYIVGNGGGYGYGIMGSSHHAIEDIAVFGGLPNMRCYIPAFIDDLHDCMNEMFIRKLPAYLRLGLGKKMPDHFVLNETGAVAENNNAELTILVQGPVANNLISALNGHYDKVEVFIINRMPLFNLSQNLCDSIIRTKKILVIEEHIVSGGLASSVSLLVHENGLPINKFISLRAEGYPDGLYGSQAYHQKISGIDEHNISLTIDNIFK